MDHGWQVQASKGKTPRKAESKNNQVCGELGHVGAKVTSIVGLFLIFKQPKAPNRSRAKLAMVLWETGPSIHPVNELPKFSVDEYREAFNQNQKCKFCDDGILRDSDIQKHVDWHNMFKTF